MLKTAQEVFNLLKKQHIEKYNGNISLNLMNISVALTDKSAVGYIFQEWLASWLSKNKINFEVNLNTQEFPDFYLNPGRHNRNLLEVKTFDIEASANFDIANFDAYCRSLETKAYRLDADYLIFGYSFVDGLLTIKEVWLKKIWEITSPSARFSVKTQVKQDIIYNIRPCTWWSDKAEYKAFETKGDFVKALYKTLIEYRGNKKIADHWIKSVEAGYIRGGGRKFL